MNKLIIYSLGVLALLRKSKPQLTPSEQSVVKTFIAKLNLTDYALHINRASNFYRVPRNYIAAIILVESFGSYDAMGMDGESGLMQITSGALEDWNEKFAHPPIEPTYTTWDLFDPFKNIAVGTGYMRILKNRFKCGWNGVVTAFNGGTPNNQISLKEYTPKVLKYEPYMSEVFEIFKTYKVTL